MTRGVLVGLFFGLLVAILGLAIAAVQIEMRKPVPFVVMDPPPGVFAENLVWALRVPSAGQSASLPGGAPEALAGGRALTRMASVSADHPPDLRALKDVPDAAALIANMGPGPDAPSQIPQTDAKVLVAEGDLETLGWGETLIDSAFGLDPAANRDTCVGLVAEGAPVVLGVERPTEIPALADTPGVIAPEVQRQFEAAQTRSLANLAPKAPQQPEPLAGARDPEISSQSLTPMGMARHTQAALFVVAVPKDPLRDRMLLARRASPAVPTLIETLSAPPLPTSGEMVGGLGASLKPAALFARFPLQPLASLDRPKPVLLVEPQFLGAVFDTQDPSVSTGPARPEQGVAFVLIQDPSGARPLPTWASAAVVSGPVHASEGQSLPLVTAETGMAGLVRAAARARDVPWLVDGDLSETLYASAADLVSEYQRPVLAASNQTAALTQLSAVPTYPAADIAGTLHRLPHRLERDGAVIVVLEDTPQIRSDVTAWLRQLGEDAPPLIPVASAIAWLAE